MNVKGLPQLPPSVRQVIGAAVVPKESGIEWCSKQKPVRLSFLGTSRDDVGKALAAVFGKFPIQLNRFEHEQALVAMMAASGELACYKQLLEGLRTFDEIEIRLT